MECESRAIRPPTSWLGSLLVVGLLVCVPQPLPAQDAAATEALELLRSSLQCPAQPLTQQVGASAITRTTALRYTGDAAGLKVDMHIVERQHNSTTNVDMELESNLSFVARFGDLETAEASGAALTLKCKAEQQCIRRVAAYSQRARPVRLRSLSLATCDQSAAANGKRAVDELIQIAAPSPAQTAVEPPYEPPPSAPMGRGFTDTMRPGAMGPGASMPSPPGLPGGMGP